MSDIKSLDAIEKAVNILHDAGLGKIKSIVVVRDIARGVGGDISLRQAKTVIDAIWSINGWDGPTIF